MLKVSRIADYGMVVLFYLVKNARKESPLSARELADLTKLPLPTVSKVLKLLAKREIIVAKRGKTGGYELLINPKDVSLLRLLEIFDGPQSITSCAHNPSMPCQIPASCPNSNFWGQINNVIVRLLSGISLLDLLEKKDMSLTAIRSMP